MRIDSARIAAVAAVFVLGGPIDAQTTNWQATASNTWSTAGNWSAGVPGVGTVAVFSTAGATQFVMNNDIAGLTLDGLTVNNLGTGAFTIDGNAFTIGTVAGINMSAATQDLTINAGITLGVNQNWVVATGRTLTVTGAVDGAGGLTVSGGGLVRVNNAASAFSGGTTINTGGVVEVFQTAAGNLRIDPATAGPLGTGTITINGGELRLTPFDPATGPIANNFTMRTVGFGANGGLLNLGRIVNGRIPITTTAGATAPAVVRTTSSNSNNWGTTNGFVLNAGSITGTGPVRFEFTDGALATLNAAQTIDAPLTFQGVDNGSAAANQSAITVPGDVTVAANRVVGRFGISNFTVTFTNGLDFRNAVQFSQFNGPAVVDADITLRTTTNGTFVGFQSRGTGTAGAYSTQTIGGATANTRTFTIENNATAVLDSRFRTDSLNIGGVILNSRTVINSGGTLQFSQSSTAQTETGFHQINGNIRGLGTDAADARVVTLLANKTANGTNIGGVNWTASTANFEVNGTGTGGLRVEGVTANLFPDFLSTTRINALTGTGGTFTVAPSDAGAILSAAPSAASAVRLGVGSSGAGSVAVTLGAAANDLNNWAGLVVKGSSGGGSTVATLAANQTLATTTVAGGTLLINGGVTLTSATTVQAGGTLGGTGTVAGAVTVNTTATIRGGAPGTTGTQTVTGNLALTAAAAAAAKLQVTAGAGGTASKLQVSGTTNFISPGGSAPFVIEILNGGGLTAGTPASLTLVTSNGGYQLNGGVITSPLPTGLYTLTSPDFSAFNSTSLVISGTDLVLSFTPVPEPATILAIAAIGLAAGRFRRRSPTLIDAAAIVT